MHCVLLFYYYLPMGITLCQKEKAHGSYLSPEKSPGNKKNLNKTMKINAGWMKVVKYNLLGKWCGHSFENI